MSDVASNLYSWSTTAASNSPADATTIGGGLADNLQEIQKVVRQDLANVPTNVASATTTDLGAVASNYCVVTGTTTITGLGTVSSGIWKFVRFSGALVLTHNATSLILPGSANITTVAGDSAMFVSEGSGNWRCLWYSGAGAHHNTLTMQSTLTMAGTAANIALGSNYISNGGTDAGLSLDASNNATLSASLTLGASGNYSLTANGTTSRYLGLLAETSTYAGALVAQAGGGSNGYGGAIVLYGHSHATKPGWVTAGISESSGGKFSVNTQGLGGGTEVFTVAGSNGDTVISGTLTVSGGSVLHTGLAYASLPTPTAGMVAYVTDSNTATWGATIAGGGANKVLAFYNGTNWTVAGA